MVVTVLPPRPLFSRRISNLSPLPIRTTFLNFSVFVEADLGAAFGSPFESKEEKGDDPNSPKSDVVEILSL